jgi:vacuolar-type H+-ATPase subunit F/Vma7
MPAFSKITVGEVFQLLKERQDVLFSFNGNILQMDSVIYPRAYKGNLYDYLDGILGKEYSFKELGKHIIVQYTPQRMSVDFEVQTPRKDKVVITGYIKNVRTNNPISNASIFDRSALLSTLTDKNGYFELDVKKRSNLIAVNVSKEMFRDTSVMVIFPIEAQTGDKKKREYGYFEGYEEDHGLYKSFFGRIFLSPAQQIQNMNLGGMFLYSPYQISMTPGLSSHGFIRSQIVNKFSLNIIGGATAGVKGVELGGVFNINQYNMQGVQVAGVFNTVGGNVGGVQLAGVGNRVFGTVKGVQIGGVLNKADTVRGVQLAGVANTVREAGKTTQIAGVINNSSGDVGIQIAGIANKAKKVKGFQLAGIVNIADSSDYPIGLLNLIKNGEKSLALAIDEDSYLALQFRSGGRVLYSVLSVGAALTNDGPSKYVFEAGLGAVLLNRSRFALRTEISSRNHLTDNFKLLDNHQSSFRVIPSYKLTDALSIFVAPSFNYAERDKDAVSGTDTRWKAWGRDRTRNTFYGGGTAGLMLKL